MVQVSAAVDGITNQGVGWTNQSSSPYSSDLESYAGPSSSLFNAANQNGYVAWSMLPDDAIASTAPAATTHGQLTRVFVPAGGPVGHLDFYLSAIGTPTAFYAGVYSATGVQLAVTAESHAALLNTGLTSLALTASTTLTGSSFVYVFTTMTYTGSPTFAGCTYLVGGTGGNIAIANANVAAATAPVTADYGVQATLPASLTLSALTGLGTKIWVGLRA